MLPAGLSITHTRSVKYKDKIIQLWRECLPGTPEGRFDWLAKGNPAGPTEWFLAVDENNGNVVGTGSLMPKELFYNGIRIKGGIVGDLMVSPTVRKQGVAQHIQRRISDSLVKLEMDFLYVVPNDKSKKLLVQAGIDHVLLLKDYLLPVDFEHYYKKLGFNLPVKFLFNFLQNLGGVFSVHTSSDEQCTISVVSNFNEEIDDLWEIVKEIQNILIGSRSSAYLNWKYCRNPVSDFRILQYRTLSGVLLGYIIFSVTNSKLHIFELISIKSKYYAGMIAELRKFAKTNQVVGIYLCTTKNNPVLKALRWRGFFPIGGDLQILYKGEMFMEKRAWAFFEGDRNI